MVSFSYNLDNIKRSRQGVFFALDFIMLSLVVVNLSWLLFDTLFTSEFFRSGLTWVSPQFTTFYSTYVHPNFVAYDLVFVAIFLTELVVRWVVAVRQKTYHRWFFYPFVHWYDVLGCIPVGSFRWLRLLRVISILYRLQKYQIIDLSKSYPVRIVRKYLDIIVEEVSDRVVINVLNGVQDEIQTGSPVVGRVASEVLLPHKGVMIEWLTGRLNAITDAVYEPRREELHHYIDKIISDAIDVDPKVAALEKLPIVGPPLIDVIENTVSDIVNHIIDTLVRDIGHPESDSLIKDLIEGALARVLEPSDELNQVSKEILIDAIDVIKEQVQVQQWKLKEKGG